MLHASARPFLSAHGADDGAGLGYVLLLLLHGGQLTVPARAPAAFIPKRACEHASMEHASMHASKEENTRTLPR